MVHIILSNKNVNSKIRRIVFDSNTKLFRLENEQQLSKNELSDIEFAHPLLIQKSILPSNKGYIYQYDDINGLLASAIYVYATLLHAANPAECTFQISPSADFNDVNTKERIYCSLNSHQFGTETISLANLEHLISEINGSRFKYINSILLNECFSTLDLPDSIDGDSLFEARESVVNLLKRPLNLTKYELRYIDPVINFGLFARENIKKNEMVMIYSGEKKNFRSTSYTTYMFRYQIDLLKMELDAHKVGNIARFINHAPKRLDKDANPHLLYANLNAIFENLNGIEIIYLEANRDILKGEQLFFSYGNDYFVSGVPEFPFTTNGKPTYEERPMSLLDELQKRSDDLKLMAKYGLKKTKYHILLRAVLIILVLFIIMQLIQ